MINDLNNFRKTGFEVDIVDISAVSKVVWLPRLQAAKDLTEPVYALDDNSALKIVDGKVEVISEGNYLTFNLLQ